MKLRKLYLKNIGPFLDDSIEFATFDNSKSQVTILTGENGAGKTIVLDAIRKLFIGFSQRYQIRPILRDKNFRLEMDMNFENKEIVLKAEQREDEPRELFTPTVNNRYFDEILKNFVDSNKSKKNTRWIVNYWTSQHDHSPFDISNLDFITPEDYLLDALDGIQKNIETTKAITFFDYYKSSDDLSEKKEGEFIYDKLKEIFRISLYDGELLHVQRTKLMPIISQNGFPITLEKLSSGNLYLAQRLISVLGQMYSVYKLNDFALEELCNTPGVLLIDEAENHLHPKWQKTFLNSILKIFPNLQIIVATHSPFIVGSVEGAKVYVCKPQDGYSIISDETDVYSNKPIEEILSTDVFGGISSFGNSEIDKLLKEREDAIRSKNKEEENRIEEKLLKINPQYFSYLEIDKIIAKIKNDKR
ncbi:AAA family ATPase [Myroides sp. LJL115]